MSWKKTSPLPWIRASRERMEDTYAYATAAMRRCDGCQQWRSTGRCQRCRLNAASRRGGSLKRDDMTRLLRLRTQARRARKRRHERRRAMRFKEVA